MKRYPLMCFFVLTFGLTWGLGACFALFPAQLIAVSGKVSVTNPLFMLAVYAPSISAIVVTGVVDGTPGIAKLLRRFLQWRNGILWYAAILIGLPVLGAIALLKAHRPRPSRGGPGSTPYAGASRSVCRSPVLQRVTCALCRGHLGRRDPLASSHGSDVSPPARDGGE